MRQLDIGGSSMLLIGVVLPFCTMMTTTETTQMSVEECNYKLDSTIEQQNKLEKNDENHAQKYIGAGNIINSKK